MAQLSVFESKVNIKSSAERFSQTYNKKPYQIPKMCPNAVKDIQLVKGDWDSIGSVRKWTYTRNSSPEVCTLVIEAMDEKSNSITSKTLDGEFKKLYSSCKFTIQAINGPYGYGSTVKTTAEYEKLNSEVSEPNHYFEYFAAVLYKGIDDYLVLNEAIVFLKSY